MHAAKLQTDRELFYLSDCNMIYYNIHVYERRTHITHLCTRVQARSIPELAAFQNWAKVQYTTTHVLSSTKADISTSFDFHHDNTAIN